MNDGLIVMRAQPFHFGHARLIDLALLLCLRVFIILGSTQEYGTQRNPFTFGERKKMIKRYFSGRGYANIHIIGLEDIFSLRWPTYVMEFILKEYPDANISHIFGGSEYDCDWFQGHNLEPHIVDRAKADYPYVSATMLREMLTYRDPRWMEYVPECNWPIVAKKFNCLDIV